MLPWIPGSPFTVHTCMCPEIEVSKRVPYRPRGKQWSVIQRTSKYVTVTLETVEKSINAPCINDYLQLEVKGGSFNAT